MKPVAIVGAGPAGIAAARTLLDHGIKPCLIDENLRGGGQIYRRQPANFQRSAKQLYGFEASKAQTVHRIMDELAPLIDYRPQTLVWNAEDNRLDLLTSGRIDSVEYSRMIVATGATDRILPVPGWTLPGVYSLGAAQIALKYQGCAIGERVVFCGSGPLLYLVAYQYAQAGAKVLAVLDSAPFSAQCRALPALLRQPATLAKGLYYRAWLAAHGIAVHQGATLSQIDGEQRVHGIRWGEQTLECDAVAFAHALRSETQLADLLGCDFAWNNLNRAWLPQRDCAGAAASRRCIWLAMAQGSWARMRRRWLANVRRWRCWRMPAFRSISTARIRCKSSWRGSRAFVRAWKPRSLSPNNGLCKPRRTDSVPLRRGQRR